MAFSMFRRGGAPDWGALERARPPRVLRMAPYVISVDALLDSLLGEKEIFGCCREF
jgi:hypothetical protein